MASSTDLQSNSGSPVYAELLCRSNASFLRGGSHPHELVETAARLGLPALALTDWGGVYGIPKAHRAKKELPPELSKNFNLLVGAEIPILDSSPLVLIAQTRQAYGLLCRWITAAHHDRPKADPALSWEQLLQLIEEDGSRNRRSELWVIPRKLSANWEALSELFPKKLLFPIFRRIEPAAHEAQRWELAQELKQRLDIPWIASNNVHYHIADRRPVQDVLTCIREGVTLKTAGYHLFQNNERYLRAPSLMASLFADHPEALSKTLEVAESCTFSPDELRYRYPSEWIPAGQTAQSYLEHLVWQGAQSRYGGLIPDDVEKQLRHELKLIHELHFADYFLTIWEIVEFARQRKILCQGRGSAANSAVCYCLGITAVDPVRMNLLFERFISTERGEPPDIDVDFEHERREEVIQHIYEKYGRDRAAMVAAVVTYRSRSSLREVSKVFGHSSPEQANDLAVEIASEIEGFPRHLSIHSGGFTLSADPIIETVPVEPARMEGRTIVQWDKDDLDSMGLLKVDVLSLGMLSALRKTLDEVKLQLSDIPPEDPSTYEMICAADTVGVFQIESRAQMSMLPRLKPRTFYDLVVELAIVRPGPIIGKMVHPYLRRKQGLEKVELPDPRLEPILGRTLGVPLFQEQIMKMAIHLAGFSPGEADRLRRAIGAWRSSGSIQKSGERLMQGLLEHGLPQSFATQIFEQIQGFAEYGFPESHAASFALLAYASAYLKCHYPGPFACALVNSQPMGFYSVHTILDDAKRHGVPVLPPNPQISRWDCQMENGAIRLGFRLIAGMQRGEYEALARARDESPFESIEDFVARAPMRKNILQTLCMGHVFDCFGLDPRQALWKVLGSELYRVNAHLPEQLTLWRAVDSANSLKDAIAFTPSQPAPPFQQLTPAEAIASDYQSYGFSVRGHPLSSIRHRLWRFPTAIEVKRMPSGRKIRSAGLVIVLQRPPTAKGTCFATLEDETGFLDLILHKSVFEAHRELFENHLLLLAEGRLQREGHAVSILVEKLRPITGPTDLSDEESPSSQLSLQA